MRISSVKPVPWLAVNLHHLFSNGAAFNTRSRSSLTSDAISRSLSQMNRLRYERDIASLVSSVAFVNENYDEISSSTNLYHVTKTRRNVNACHVTMTIIKCIMQYCWRIKTRLNVVYILKTTKMSPFSLTETKCYNVISSRLVALLLFCSICFLCLTSGRQGCQVFATKPAQLLLKTSPIAFRGGSLVKFAFRGLNITLLGSLQPADMKNNPRQQC